MIIFKKIIPSLFIFSLLAMPAFNLSADEDSNYESEIARGDRGGGRWGGGRGDWGGGRGDWGRHGGDWGRHGDWGGRYYGGRGWDGDRYSSGYYGSGVGIGVYGDGYSDGYYDSNYYYPSTEYYYGY